MPDVSIQGLGQESSKEEGRVTLCQIKGTHQIAMSTSMPCLKKVCKGGGGGGSWAHQDPLPLNYVLAIQLRPDTCGFTRMENEDFGMVDLSSSEF